MAQVGTLVTGSVRRIEPFGVFVGINNTRVSGLLHISNVSRQHIETVQVSGVVDLYRPRLPVVSNSTILRKVPEWHHRTTDRFAGCVRGW